MTPQSQYVRPLLSLFIRRQYTRVTVSTASSPRGPKIRVCCVPPNLSPKQICPTPQGKQDSFRIRQGNKEYNVCGRASDSTENGHTFRRPRVLPSRPPIREGDKETQNETL